MGQGGPLLPLSLGPSALAGGARARGPLLAVGHSFFKLGLLLFQAGWLFQAGLLFQALLFQASSFGYFAKFCTNLDKVSFFKLTLVPLWTTLAGYRWA